MNRKFDYAISFSGSQRGLARELSNKLKKVGLKVFFDEDFEHEMLGGDGADYLNSVFLSNLVIASL